MYHAQVPERRPPGPPPVELLPGYQIGYQKGYDAAYKAGCKQSRAASSDWWEEDDHGGIDGGDKKKLQNTKSKSAGSFTQWFDKYHKKYLVNLKEFPRVELWTDTKWEP